MKRLNVLLSAYSCRPNMGSEPGVGWQTAQQLSQTHHVWVLTRDDNRPSIEAERLLHPNPNLQVVYCQVPGQPLGLRSGQQLHYYLWQLLVYRIALQLQQQHHFDIAQHITYVKYWSPSLISLLPVPFVWGPVGGGESAPSAFVQGFSVRGQVSETLRNTARWLAEHGPLVRLTARRAKIALATTDETAQRLKKLGAESVAVCSQLGLSHSELATLAALPDAAFSESESPSRLLSIGRLLHWKGFHLSLQAFAQANLPETVEYWIVGNGPEKVRLQRLAKQLEIDHKVKFLSEMPRRDVLAHLGCAIALVHPSLHDSGGFVCLEAMAAGIPVLCLNLGGPALQVTDQTGIKVEATIPEETISELAKSMTELAAQPAHCKKLGQAGQQRARETFTWTRKGEYFSSIYHQLVSQSLQDSPENLSPTNPCSLPTATHFLCQPSLYLVDGCYPHQKRLFARKPRGSLALTRSMLVPDECQV